jgi:hypothetical protein
MIDPEFWSDEEIGKWSFQARLFYIGLWNFADDTGRFKAANALLKAQIFPYENKIDIEKLKKELNHKIQWYEVEELQYGYIRNFLKYQRIDKPTASKLPVPPQFDDSSPNTQGGLPPNISKYNISKDHPPTPQPLKNLFLEFVYLSEPEYTKLVTEFGDSLTKEYIKRLNDYIGSKGVKYKSHYHTILVWAKKDEPIKVKQHTQKL